MSYALDRFGTEHRHVMALAAASIRELADGKAKRSAFDLFAARLRAHLDLEERAIFPAIERFVGEPDFALTATLRREHASMRALLAEIERELDGERQPGATGNLLELQAMLGAHERKERHVLYPMADRALADADDDLRALLDDHAPR